METYKVLCYTYLSVCYVHSLWRYTKSTATLNSVVVMFTPCGDIQSPLLHLPQCLSCSLQPPLSVETYKVHCYTYLSVCYVHSNHHSLWRHTKSTATLTLVFVMFHSSHHSLWKYTKSTATLNSVFVMFHSSHHSLLRHTKSTATLTLVFVMFTPATTPCGDIQSPLLHLP